MNALKIDETVYREARMKAIGQNTTIKAVIEHLLRAWLTEGWAETARELELQRCLHELVATVRGECPSLLNEDSGGDARLSLAIDEVLNTCSTATHLREVKL